MMNNSVECSLFWSRILFHFEIYQIIDKIRGENYPVTDRSIDFQIVGLRKKMLGKGNLIETIRGVGYRFQHNET